MKIITIANQKGGVGKTTSAVTLAHGLALSNQRTARALVACFLGQTLWDAPADRGLVQEGLYRLVRHPLYLGELVLRLALAVGSTEALVWMPFMLSLHILRAVREERILAGYAPYAQRVRWRLIPFIF